MKTSKFSRFEFLALLISLFAFGISVVVTFQIYEGIPHIEDEIAYAWQAKLYAGGNLTVASPPCPQCFLVPFIVDHQGLRFSKYPPGWPVVLSFGDLLGVRPFINPFIAGLTVWWLYRLGKKIFNAKIALLAAFLTSISPFFLMNSGSLLAHPWSLLLSIVFVCAWLDTFDSEHPLPAWITILTASFTLGLLALTRPLTAVAVLLPFAVHGVIILLKGKKRDRVNLVLIGIVTGLIASLYFVWQYALTGDPLLNPYTLYWAYDKIGFGPGHGVQSGGYTLQNAWTNMKFSLSVGNHDLFGWPYISWLFLPFGLFAFRKNTKAWLITALFPSMLITYTLYWIGSWLFGPRYYYESLPALSLLTSAGIFWLIGKLDLKLKPKIHFEFGTVRFASILLIISLLVSANLLYYTPTRLNMMHGLYGITRSQLDPFLTPKAVELAPALVIVHIHNKWHQYGSLLELSSPYLDTPFIFTLSKGKEADQTLVSAFPNRTILYYYTKTPYVFYTNWGY
jgi:hypothetical protein